MPLIKARALSPEDTIGVIAPASRPVLPSTLAAGVRALESMGFGVRLGRHVMAQHGFLAGTDAERLQDLHEMFESTDIHGIVCARGGYGCGRLLPCVDFDLIRSNPKILVGYSDITALQMAILKETKLVSFWGPMVASEMGKHPFHEYNRTGFLRATTETNAIGTVPHPPGAEPLHSLSEGTATGPLVGGTLSLLAAGIGTPWDIDTDGAILFLEEVGEEPHKIDRMLNQLKSAGKLARVAGVIIGECHGCGSSAHAPAFPYGSFTIEEVFTDYFGSLGVPCIYGMAIGHGQFKSTFPLGVSATLDGRNRTLTINESGVV